MFRRFWILAVLVALIAFALWHPAPRAPAVAVAAPEPARPVRARKRRPDPSAGGVIVYVVGAVRRPGLYRLPADARVDDAVRQAGGLRDDADPAGINLAARAQDGDEIVAPVLGQTVPVAQRTKRSRSTRSRKIVEKSEAIVSINAASAETLATVPGIGVTIAARIVEVRERDGAFTTFDDLLDVAGMTESRLERAQPYLRL